MITPKEKQELILKAKLEALENLKEKLQPFLRQNSVYFHNSINEFFRLEIKQINEQLKKLWENSKLF